MNVPKGREDIARLFQKITQNDRLAQSYIIAAPGGMGKKTVTEYILSLILCETHSSCGRCSSCKSLEAHCHPDVIYLKREEDKASLGVDVVRAFKNEVYTRPVMSEHKVVVVEEAHLATAGAQNAMLKIIEEPPKGVVFFLLCDSLLNILPTIESRSVVFNLKPLSCDTLRDITGADDFLVSVCGGNIGKLKKLMEDTLYTDFRDEVADAFFSLRTGDAFSPYESAKKLDKYKQRAPEVFELLLSFARDAYFLKCSLSERITKTK